MCACSECEQHVSEGHGSGLSLLAHASVASAGLSTVWPSVLSEGNPLRWQLRQKMQPVDE